jgi:glucose/arabinose dehydrogenase
MMFKNKYLFIAGMALTAACNNSKKIKQPAATSFVQVTGDTVQLPLPFATAATRNNSKTKGWPADKTPVAPEGFKVTKFADSLDNPRWIYVAPNGDVFVAMANTISDGFTKTASEGKPATKSSNTILLLRDTDGDGIPETKNFMWAIRMHW